MEVTDLAVTSHHILHILWDRSTSCSLAHTQEEGILQGRGYQESGQNLLSMVHMTIFCPPFNTIQ